MGTEDEGIGQEAGQGAEDAGEVTPVDVLLMMAMQQLETGEKVDVIDTLVSLGMDDIVEAAKIGRETEEDDEFPPDDPEGDEIDDAEVPGDAELGE